MACVYQWPTILIEPLPSSVWDWYEYSWLPVLVYWSNAYNAGLVWCSDYFTTTNKKKRSIDVINKLLITFILLNLIY